MRTFINIKKIIMTQPLLKVSHVSKRFTRHVALDDMSIEVPQGSIYGLLGPNGAGKTTLIRIINHITLPDSGEVVFDGHPLTMADVAHIGYLPEERGLYKKMKVGEQAIFFARLKGLSRAQAVTELKKWFEKFEIMEWWGKKVSELSKGMAQKVQFIITVLHRPKLLIFDEPFSGFDPINANMLKEEIMELRREGSTIIFSTHNMSSVEEICDDITLINSSRNVLSGNVDEIRRRFCKDRYVIGLADEGDKLLLPSIEPMTVKRTMERNDDGTSTLKVHLSPDADVRGLINAVNEHGTILSFNEAMASMNDIFINVVESTRL